jgi:metal-dependent amidase/aminoacylase/carboxypeptidase family protein
VLSITNIRAGTGKENIIPSEAEIKGVIRTFDSNDHTTILNNMKIMLANAEAFGYKAILQYKESYPSVINGTYGQQKVITSALQMLKEEDVIAEGEPEAWGEDFAYYLQVVPGAFFIIGSGNANGTSAPLHSPDFDIDENILSIGAAVMANIVLDINYCGA